MHFTLMWRGWLAAIALGAALMVGCDSGGGGGGGGGGGTVAAGEAVARTTPASGAVGVSPDAEVRITFSKPAVPGSEEGGIDPDVAFGVDWSAEHTELVVGFASPLTSGTTYTVSLTGLTFADGTRLGGVYSMSFTVGEETACADDTDCGDGEVCTAQGQCVAEGSGGCDPAQCPFVASTAAMAVLCTTPLPCATNVSVTDAMIIEFTQPFDFNDLGADLLSETGQSFDVAVGQSADQTRLIVTPNEPLLDDHSYALAIDYVGDLQGNRTEIDQTYCFSTGATLNCPSAPECEDVDVTDAGVSAAADFDYQPPFAADSIWNTPIEADPQISAESGTLIAGFADVYNAQGGIVVSVRHDSVPVYVADSSTPRVTVELTDVYAQADQIENVPLLSAAIPDCGFDSLITALDPDTGTFYEFWRAKRLADGSWQAANGNSIDAVASSGIYAGNGVTAEGMRASGFSLLGGLIWPHELEAGVIDHALVFYYFPTRSGGSVAPATGSDGAVDDSGALPMGSHLQLDPDLDLDALALDDWERTIATALQDYGMYLGDTGSGIGLGMLHAYSFEGNPYEGLLPESVISEGVVFIDKLPPDRFRVLSPPG